MCTTTNDAWILIQETSALMTWGLAEAQEQGLERMQSKLVRAICEDFNIPLEQANSIPEGAPLGGKSIQVYQALENWLSRGIPGSVEIRKLRN